MLGTKTPATTLLETLATQGTKSFASYHKVNTQAISRSLILVRPTSLDLSLPKSSLKVKAYTLQLQIQATTKCAQKYGYTISDDQYKMWHALIGCFKITHAKQAPSGLCKPRPQPGAHWAAVTKRVTQCFRLRLCAV